MVGMGAADVEDAAPELVVVRVAGVALDSPPGEVGSLPGEEKSPPDVAGPWPSELMLQQMSQVPDLQTRGLDLQKPMRHQK